MPSFNNIQAIITDIEGTTSSISFVKDILFPYAKKHLASFIKQHQDITEVRMQLNAVAETCSIPAQDTKQIIQQLQNWIKDDVKATPLKNLQGMIWQEGYQNSAYKAHVYPDAVDILKEWNKKELPLYVYSSGSVLAQKLFFSHSSAGDLLPLFSGHFDTNIGPKQEAQSYLNIQRALDIDAENLLFLSDISQELDAARQAGFQTCHVIRDNQTTKQNTVSSNSAPSHPQINSFQQITLCSQIAI